MSHCTEWLVGTLLFPQEYTVHSLLPQQHGWGALASLGFPRKAQEDRTLTGPLFIRVKAELSVLRLAARRRLVPPSGGWFSQLKRGPVSVRSSCAFRGKPRQSSAPQPCCCGQRRNCCGSGECTVYSCGKRRVPTDFFFFFLHFTYSAEM